MTNTNKIFHNKQKNNIFKSQNIQKVQISYQYPTINLSRQCSTTDWGGSMYKLPSVLVQGRVNEFL